MEIQIPKQNIDLGQIGNASTGDILYDGGKKINENFDAVYNSFGDQRMFAADAGSGNMTIHATGYYQKATHPTEYLTPIPLGSLRDIDTTDGAVQVTLAKGKAGECIEFVNSNGSFSVNNPLSIQAIDNFEGLSGNLIVTQPYSKVTCWCISAENNVSVWRYSITSMFSHSVNPIEGTWQIPAGSIPLKLRICNELEFNTIKLLTSAQTSDSSKLRTSEIHLLINSVRNEVYSSEFAVMRQGNTSEEDEIITYSFEIDALGNVNMIFNSTVVGLRVAVKTISALKIGAPQ
ncbi:baseplate wedge tail fiber protein connector [Pseudomonas phage PspYZU05]|uniref:Baseplate wedge completion tail fiber socket n=1 Tax=Pseudomonas phage PspYZU05 TaxID=1983556 RepID=A0A2U7NBU2_9CAUD|nr:baseplate wedge tail fiber protein connector [Pseudomonas phage PspYZU05]ASD52069.1 baseplate wedge completion tail fiber socket [Pseudomonas phage PspYZU05]